MGNELKSRVTFANNGSNVTCPPPDSAAPTLEWKWLICSPLCCRPGGGARLTESADAELMWTYSPPPSCLSRLRTAENGFKRVWSRRGGGGGRVCYRLHAYDVTFHRLAWCQMLEKCYFKVYLNFVSREEFKNQHIIIKPFQLSVRLTLQADNW